MRSGNTRKPSTRSPEPCSTPERHPAIKPDPSPDIGRRGIPSGPQWSNPAGIVQGPDLFSKTLRSADISGMHLSFDLIRRFKPEGRGLVHDRVTEIYEIVDGSGVLVSGGLLLHTSPIPPRPDTLTIGPSRESPDLQGGVRWPVAGGDVVIIPAGTPHEFASINGHITYRVTRIDPGH